MGMCLSSARMASLALRPYFSSMAASLGGLVEGKEIRGKVWEGRIGEGMCTLGLGYLWRDWVSFRQTA